MITATLHHWSVSGDTGGPGYPHYSRPEEKLKKGSNTLKRMKHWNNSDLYLRETFKKKSFISRGPLMRNMEALHFG